jgi:uncharacterized protein
VSGALRVSVCRACGRMVFPPRLLCPNCGGASWRRARAGPGGVEEVTTVSHAVGAGGEVAVALASVRLDAGPVVVARIDGDASPGDRVELIAVDGAPTVPARSPGSTRRR